MKIFITALIFMTLFSCLGSKKNNLGNGFHIMKGDREEDDVVVYCKDTDNSGCFAGIYIVPSYDLHYDSIGKYHVYVLGAAVNNNLIAVETFNKFTADTNYWFINKSLSFHLDTCVVNCEKSINKYCEGPFDKEKALEYLGAKKTKLKKMFGHSKIFSDYMKDM